MKMKCSVCGHELGDPYDLQEQVRKSQYDTPEEAGFDPAEVTWLCGDHSQETGDGWNPDIPYWYG
jgi:hypothetical protein